MRLFFLAFIVSLAFSAQASEDAKPAVETKHEEVVHEEDGLQEVAAKQSSRDVKIPHALVHLIEKEYKAYFVAEEKKSKDDVAEVVINRRLLNMAVEFTQKRKAALREDVRITTPLGGGVVDLQEIVTPLRGAFRMKIRARKEEGGDLENLKFYYISHAEKRSLDGDSFGAGCGKYLDMSTFYNKQLSKDGLELFSADQRYLSVIAGTFVAFAFSKDSLYIGSVTFEDGRYPSLQCEI